MKHDLIELGGLHLGLWPYNGKHERQSRILITAEESCCRLSKQARTTEQAGDAFCVSLLRNISPGSGQYSKVLNGCARETIWFKIYEVSAIQSKLKRILIIDIHQP